ncbi:MAG: helix-turn-helix domain-containing protein [Catonella sp.]|nr:MAG: helix-turn-helix domain-containing protein [Catonella sp.]
MTNKDKRRLKQTGERIKAVRKKLGLTMAEFGEPIGAKPSAISNWERGEYYPSHKFLLALEERYDIPINFMLYGEEVVYIIKECRKVGDIATDKIILRAYKSRRAAQEQASIMAYNNPRNIYQVLGMEVV